MTLFQKLVKKLCTDWACSAQDMQNAWASNSYGLYLLDRSFTEFRDLTLAERKELEIYGEAYAFKVWGRDTTYYVYCVPQTRDGQGYKHPRIMSKAGRLRMLKSIPQAA